MFYVEILIAAAAVFVLGALWYGKLFSKYWQSQTGITDEQASKNLALTHGLSFLAMLALGYYIQSNSGLHYAFSDPGPTITHGPYHVLFQVVPCVLLILVINYLYQKRSIGLFLVDAGYYISVILITAGIISALTLYDNTQSEEDYLNKKIETYEKRLKSSQDALDAFKERETE